ncbi:dual specificity protein phosphatase family protein [Thalassoroseus pseudoceratinae]|uniref:dual specificity protein phosphatase family protein n=1 Tax=Thalassoroseus pseudoceratinae TaxID=2713176 RepID=UPI0014219754|nr:dual specificity protein phosphatase [Thalassoroseus pseudoceratinae]
MRRIPPHALWIGNEGTLRDPRLVCDAGIKAIVELADSEAFAELPRELIRCRFPLSDGGENSEWLLKIVAQTITEFVEAEVPTLVCCSAGMSRSVCMAAAAMSLFDKTSFTQAVMQVSADGPADISPRLFEQVQNAVKAIA